MEVGCFSTRNLLKEARRRWVEKKEQIDWLLFVILESALLFLFYALFPHLSFYFLVFPFFSYVERLSEASYFYSKQTWEAIVFPFGVSRLSSSTCRFNCELTFSIPIDFDVPSVCHAQLALCHRNGSPYVYAESVYIIHCIRPSVTLFVSETNNDRTRVNPDFVLGRTAPKKKMLKNVAVTCR